jgi:hypothetical protein
MIDAIDRTPDGLSMPAPEQRVRSTLAGRARDTLAGGAKNA